MINLGGTRLKPVESAAGLLEVIETYEATVAEDEHTFTFAAVDFDDVSKLMLVADLAAVALLSLQMQINGDVSTNYSTSGRRISGGEVLINLTSQDSMQLATSTAFSGGNRGGQVNVDIGLHKGGASTRPTANSTVVGAVGTDQEVLGSALAVNTSSISSLRVFTSGNNWNIGARMTLYKLSR